MKILLLNFLILVPISLFSQVTNKLEVSDTIINVKKKLITELGDEMANRFAHLDSMKSKISFGLLSLENTLITNKKGNTHKLASMCQCRIIEGQLEIANAIGFMAGIANVIKIDISDSTYQTMLTYNTDGVKSHKFNPQDEFIEDIEVEIPKPKLILSQDSKFVHNATIKGILIGNTIDYYEQNNTQSGIEKVQMKVRSIFECKLIDYDKMLLEMKKKQELEEKGN